MAVELLSTKVLLPPARHTLVTRPRLTDKLNEGARRRLILVSAPAGFGKTTLLTEWARQSDRRVAWLSLEVADNDSARFVSYLVASLQSVLEGIGSNALELLHGFPENTTESALTALLNELSGISEGLSVVLDDYHCINSPAVHDALAFLLDHLPPAVNLVIGSRTEPSLPLPRLRARGELMELRSPDLRFTVSEAATFVREGMGLGLTKDDISELQSRTEGWIAGLHLAALSLDTQRDMASFIKSLAGDNRHIFDYLAGEVLQEQPAEIQSFLLQTSILDRMNGQLCEAVTGSQNGQDIIEMVERLNLFVVPLDSERRWYRYHHLFREFLSGVLRRQQPDLVSALHARAAAWCEQHGLLEVAISHAFSAKDHKKAAFLVEQAASAALMRGELTSLQSWLGKLPEEFIRTRPRLCLSDAWTSMASFAMGRFEARLRMAESLLGVDEHESLAAIRKNITESRSPDEAVATGELLGEVAVGRSCLAAIEEDLPQTIELGQQALEFLPSDSWLWRGAVAMNVGRAYYVNGDLQAAGAAFAEAPGTSGRVGNRLLSVGALGLLGEVKMRQGELSTAEQLQREALGLASERGGPELPMAWMAHLGFSVVFYQRNDLEAAAQHAVAGIDLGTQLGNAEALAHGHLNLAQVKEAQSDFSGAHEAVREAGRIAKDDDLERWINRTETHKARICLRQGELEAVSSWIRGSGLSPDDEPSYAREEEHIMLARATLALGNPEEATRLLSRLLPEAEAGVRMWNVIEILILQAMAYEAQKETGAASSAVRRALSLSEPEQFIRMFVDEGPSMAALLRHAVASGHSVDYSGKLLSAFDQTGTRPAEPLSGKAAQALPEPLSQRELEVLRLISAGLSNQAIADEMVVALTTVKWHINKIYGKLGVHSRTQAIATARDLNLL